MEFRKWFANDIMGKIKGSKADKVHGYGLANIHRVAVKYAGGIAIDVKDVMFCLCVLLMVEAWHDAFAEYSMFTAENVCSTAFRFI